jgi:preprotein translocase subunit SecE
MKEGQTKQDLNIVRSQKRNFLIYGILVGLITPILSLLLEVIDLSSSIYYLGGLYYLTLFILWKTWPFPYIFESFTELRDHVSWTPLVELQSKTLVVLVFSLIFALIIWLADTVLGEIFELYFQFV